MYERVLQMDLPAGRSAFLWGPRKSGKSTYLKQRFPDSTRYDFLQTDLFFRLSKNPALLREELLALHHAGSLGQPVILDEVQKIPAVLDEVHWLMENHNLSFILCGSSARKLRSGHANLLGGRAWRFEMYPLTVYEIPNFDLLRALNRGMLPSHYEDAYHDRTLRAYVQDYLKEEIMAEGLTRNMPAFARFLDALAYSQGELVNFANVARDCGVDAKTVKGYFEILVDTLLGIFIEPFSRKVGRDIIISTSKFYLFDVGVAGYLAKRRIAETKGAEFGHAFEHFVLMELLAYRGYSEKDFPVRFWRTKTGLEVDWVLGDAEVAIEVKGSARVGGSDVRALKAFSEEHKPRQACVVCNEPRQRMMDDILILPWQEFLELLWDGKMI